MDEEDRAFEEYYWPQSDWDDSYEDYFRDGDFDAPDLAPCDEDLDEIARR